MKRQPIVVSSTLAVRENALRDQQVVELGTLATGVHSIRFTVFSAQNSGAGVSEIDVFGAAAVPEPTAVGLLGIGGVLLLARRRRTA